MLEGKGSHILDTLDGHGERVSRKALADNQLDATNVVGRAPVTLVEQLLVEARELERLKIAILCEFCSLSALSC